MRFLYKRFIQKLLQIDDTPESIALGTAMGTFIAMTPTVGIQMILILILCMFIRANRLAGLVMVYISNPFTILPIYWLDYLVGEACLGREPITQEAFAARFNGFTDAMAHAGFLELFSEFWYALVDLGADLSVPMFLGGSVLGLALGVPAYPITLLIVRAHRRRKERQHEEEGSITGTTAADPPSADESDQSDASSAEKRVESKPCATEDR